MTALDTAPPAGAAPAPRQISLLRELQSLPVAAGEPPVRRRRDDGWLDRWLDTCSDLARLQATNPMLDAVIDEIDGRRIRIGDHWLADFASCNYLGFDLEPEIMAAIEPRVATWGTHPSWSRLLGSPTLYEEIEVRLTELLGAPDTLVLPTITHIHTSVIPVLAGGGTIFLDRRAHKTIYDGTKIATSNGARVQRYEHDNLDQLEELLRNAAGGSRLVCMDGVNSMTGNAPDLHAFARVAREHDAILYVDDAHGFGVIGERRPDEPCNWGARGNSIVRHFGETYDNIVLVGGFSKAYSSLLAFLALPSRLKNVLKIAAAPYLYSGPSPVASLATVLAGFDVNDARGDDIRRDLYAKSHKILDGLDALGINTPNTSGFPIIEIPLGDATRIDDVGRFLFDRGIYVTLAAFPLVPRAEVGFRVQVTAANTEEEVDHLLAVLAEASDRFGLAGAWPGPGVSSAGPH
jgi:8-amino-7-oxononanoate synthase